MRRPPSINLFRYLDYRKFLSDWYQTQKQSAASISFRTFSRKAGFKSTNFFKLVMDGDRNLSEESLSQFVVGLKLNKQEQEFFRNLVWFNQARTQEQKNLYYQRLLRSRKFSQLKPIEKDQYEYYSDWYHPVVRELVVSKRYDGTPASIAKEIFPPLTVLQVEKSIGLLEKLGLIEKAPRRKWRQSSTLISTGAEVSSHVVFNYHKVLLDLAKEILDKVPTDRRDVSTLTLGVVKGRLGQLKKKVQEFRQEILKLVAMDSEPEEVVQLNIQLFPVTQSAETPGEAR